MQNKIDKLISNIKLYHPEFQIKYKDESKLMKFIGKILFFNKTFMTNFVTVIGDKIYFPSKKNYQDRYTNYPKSLYATLAHEYVHIHDDSRSKWFKYSYLFPQVLASFSLLALLAFISPLFLISLLFLIFAIPFKSKGRTEAELRGYTMSLLIDRLNYNVDPGANRRLPHIVNNFIGPAYYYMWNDPYYIRNQLITRARKDPDELGEPYARVARILRGDE